eukprot:611178-Rhodomonas_salina.1
MPSRLGPGRVQSHATTTDLHRPSAGGAQTTTLDGLRVGRKNVGILRIGIPTTCGTRVTVCLDAYSLAGKEFLHRNA